MRTGIAETEQASVNQMSGSQPQWRGWVFLKTARRHQAQTDPSATDTDMFWKWITAGPPTSCL